MWQRTSALVFLAAMATTDRPAVACGPDFPTNLLTRRADALQTLWDGSFLEEAGRLVPAPDLTPPAIPPGDVPSAIELATYQRGADAFHAGDLVVATRAWQEILRLPAAQRRHRSTWAAFMLHDHAQVRALVRAGFYDEHYLAAFQLGELAKVELAHGRIAAAVRLYAEQAAAGDPSGATSLLFVVRAAVTDPERTRQLLRDDVGLRLLAAFYYTRHDELGAAGAKSLATVLRAEAQKRGIGLHLLAAAAYREGNFEDAAAFAARAPEELLAKWVRAKLALRDGDTQTARRYLTEVEAAHPTRCELDEEHTDPLALARGELGLVALADRRFGEALAWFRAGHQFVEASYIAERVMSVDELAAVVGPAHPQAYATCAWLDEPDLASCWTRDLSTLYAKRLMRVGRFADAAPYFDPELRDRAEQYGAIVAEAAATVDPMHRAERLFIASRRAREQGMALMGTEHAPDWAMYEGDYARPSVCPPGHAADHDGEDDLGEGCITPKVADRAYTSADEVARVASSAPAENVRFHYRVLASHLAEAAADLVPPRSQAFATLLCHAAAYVRDRDPGREKALYLRYVNQGPVGFGSGFGHSCGEPDFAHARTFARDHAPPHRSLFARVRGVVGRHVALAIVGLVLVMVMALGGMLLRRRSHPIEL